MKSIVFIVISLGNSKYLDELLLNLSSSFRVILVDNSRNEKCKLYSEKYNIEYVTENVQGISQARNRGASLVNNEDYLFFLDDDLELCGNWRRVIENILNEKNTFYCLGGRVIAKYDMSINIPNKYLYLVGEKDYGETIKTIKNNYLGGCNLLIDRETFQEVKGFDIRFGHKGNNIGANEDVVIQDMIRKQGKPITYYADLVFIHHWDGDREQIIQKLLIQGESDRKTDIHTNKIRFLLRLIKYNIYVLIKEWKMESLSSIQWTEESFDLIRYKSYLNFRC